MYIFGIGGFYFFSKDFQADKNALNSSFVLAVASVINVGLRNGGGVSESLQQVKSYHLDSSVSEAYFWGRYTYDISFFILINMLFIQIIFGIILDSFGELRKKQDELEVEVKTKCFICVIWLKNIIKIIWDFGLFWMLKSQGFLLIFSLFFRVCHEDTSIVTVKMGGMIIFTSDITLITWCFS